MPIAEITRADAAERARVIRVGSYDITLDLTMGSQVFGSRSVIRFGCAEPGSASYLDLVAEAVREITLNGTPVDPARAWSEGRIALDGLAADNELVVDAECAYTRSGTGLHRSVDSADGSVYTYAKSEPAYARTVFACFDQPDLKAEFTFHVTAPEHWTVLSNQPAPEPARRGDGRADWHFPPTPRVSGYITTVVAGDYAVVRDSHVTPGGQHIPLELACRRSLAGFLDAEVIFGITKLGLDYFTELFGCGYPFEKYGQAFVPEFSAGATEDAGCVLVAEQFLFRSRVTQTLHELRTIVILHEMAHMWFGDLVTMAWWDDLWLSEAFAEFCGHLATAEATQYAGAWATFCVSRKMWAFTQDRLPSTHPVAGDAPTLSAAIANFDGISYAKGASVLRQLMAAIGRDTFFEAAGEYFAEHGWGNASRADFLSAAEAASGRSLQRWSAAWLETAGPSTLHCEFETDADGAFTRVAVVQEPAGLDRVLLPHHVMVGCYRWDGGSLVLTDLAEADVTGASAEVSGLVGIVRPDLLLLNADDVDYAVVRFDARSLATITSSIGELADPVARAVCWTAVIDMVQQAELSVPAFVAMLARGIRREPSVSVLQALLDRTAQILLQLADPRWVQEGLRSLAEVAAEMLGESEPGSDHQLAWAQLLSWTATSTAQLDLTAGLLNGSRTVPSLELSLDLRWSLLQRLCAAGVSGDADIEVLLQQDPTDAGRRNAAACAAAMPDAAHKEAAWQTLTGDEAGVDTLVAVARGFSQPGQADLLGPFADRYLPVLERLWDGDAAGPGGSGHQRVLLGDRLFPYQAASPALLERIDGFMAAGPRDPGLVRVLAERRDIASRALASRALDG
jgi:aminopeptidase N